MLVLLWLPPTFLLVVEMTATVRMMKNEMVVKVILMLLMFVV